MVNFVSWILAGCTLSLVITRLARSHAAADILLNALAGMVAAFLAGLAVQIVLPTAHNAGTFSLAALAAAVGGAGLMLSLINRRWVAERAVKTLPRERSDEAGG